MIIDFLRTTISKEELATALKVLHKFKNCESPEEYLGIMFDAWIKLEQLEEYLEYLVNNKPLKEDTLTQLENKK